MTHFQFAVLVDADLIPESESEGEMKFIYKPTQAQGTAVGAGKIY